MSQGIDIPGKFRASNGQYVAILSRDGSKILMSQDLQGEVRMLTLDPGPYSPLQSEDYRKGVCRILGFDKQETHIIEEQDFQQYPTISDTGLFVSLSIIETTSDDFNVELPLLWVNWKQSATVFVSTTKHPAVSHYLESFLDNLGCEIQKGRRCPWYCFGYYRRILPLLTKHLEKFGCVVDGQPEQVNFSLRSSVYRIPSKKGNLFFKACSRRSDEMVVTQAISNMFPKQLAPLIGIIPELKGILTLDVSPTLCKIWGVANTQNSRKYHQKKVLSNLVMMQWAGFQQRSASYVSELKASGLPVCDEEWINKCVRHLITYARDHELLSPEQLSLLEKCHRVIRHCFALWETSGIPETLVHGDFMEYNIAQPGGPGTPVVVFDMGRTCIAYPFFDLPDSVNSPLSLGETAYLQCWESYTDMGTITELAKRTKVLQVMWEAILFMNEQEPLSDEALKCSISGYIEYIVKAIDSSPLRDKHADT